MPSSQIYVQLVGDSIDVKRLMAEVHDSEWEILAKDDGYYVCSKKINELSDHKEITAIVDSFLKRANGAMTLLNHKYRAVKSGSIVEELENGQRNITMVINETLEIRTGSILSGNLRNAGESLSNRTINRLEYYLEKASNDKIVEKVLDILNDLSWSNLYKVYELIAEDVKGQNQLYELIDKRKIKHFTQAAQSPGLLGEQARHASEKRFPAPKTPLSLKDAHAIIKELFDNWVRSK